MSEGAWWAIFSGTAEAFRALQRHLPEITVRQEDDAFLISAPTIFSPEKGAAERLEEFAKEANAVLLRAGEAGGPIASRGSMFFETSAGRREAYLMLAGVGSYSLVGRPMIVSGIGRTSSVEPRPLRERVNELRARSPEFKTAADLLARAGEDLREVYKAMEAIERANGGFPSKKNVVNRLARQRFAESIGTTDEQWAELHRSARAARHAYPHDVRRDQDDTEDSGTTYSPGEVRAAVEHALRYWLAREVPT